MTSKSPSVSQQVISALTENTARLSELKSSMLALSAAVDRVTSTSDEIQRALRGSNGNSGLIGRIELLEENRCDLAEVEDAIQGKANEPGLLERMRKCERFQDNVQKWFYLIISAILLDFGMRLWPELLNLVK